MLHSNTFLLASKSSTYNRKFLRSNALFFLKVVISVCIGTAVLLCLTVFACWKRNRRLEYKYCRLARQRASPSSNSLGSTLLSDGKDNQENDCDSDLAAAESCALDDDEEEEEVSVTVPMKSFGLVNKIRSMTSSKVCIYHLNCLSKLKLRFHYRVNPAVRLRLSN